MLPEIGESLLSIAFRNGESRTCVTADHWLAPIAGSFLLAAVKVQTIRATTPRAGIYAPP
jgi:hypothetical protein